MMFKSFRVLAAIVAIGLSGCQQPQEYIDGAKKMICIDGVEYITINPSFNNAMMSPHLKRNGMPYTCGDVPDPFDPD